MAIHAAQLARQAARRQRSSARTAALTPAIALRRPPPPVATRPPASAEPRIESPFSSHRRTSLLAAEPGGLPAGGPGARRSLQLNGEAGRGGGGGRPLVQPLFAQLAEMHQVAPGCMYPVSTHDFSATGTGSGAMQQRTFFLL